MRLKNQFGRPIDNKLSSLDPLSLLRYSILTSGVYTIVPAFFLSSLLTPKVLGDLIPLNTQPKSVSVTRIWFLKSKPNWHLCQSMYLGQLPGLSEDLSTVFLLKNEFLPNFFNYFIVTVYFYGKVVIFVVTCIFLILITKRP